MKTAHINRRGFLRSMVSGIGAVSLLHSATGAGKPNFIIILADNIGYGDFGCYGGTKQRTTNIDRMAKEGVRFTSFYVTSGVCTPSRASLMTGCYPRRVGLDYTESDGEVLRPDSPCGLNPEEITVAEVLKPQGYFNAIVGKWHLGDQPPFLPTRQGFDYYFGIPYSDDMVGGLMHKGGKIPYPPLPLMENERVIEAPVDRDTLTKRYTEETIDLIEQHRNQPFFIYLAHAEPGSTAVPNSSERFHGNSANGPYGDALEELDWSTGEILGELARLNLDDRTLVIWTSDNGAVQWTPPRGSNLPLRGWGYTTEEGRRVPCVARWPGKIPSGNVCDAIVTTMDVLPTFAMLAGTRPPQDRIIDGKDIWPLLSRQTTKSPYDAFYYYYGPQLQAVRSGRWKLILPLEERWTSVPGKTARSSAELYDLQNDIGSTANVAADHPGVVRRLIALAEKAREDLGDWKHPGKGQRPVGRVPNPRPQLL